ncbi:hypothetical protein GCM10023094_51430 [Rhodococcus olei]|uniref:Uncharacterized protein n=1 Tax=Rhodococcus olei TaxID=2161675 RepID=A0ABP8PP74_9NOCA
MTHAANRGPRTSTCRPDTPPVTGALTGVVWVGIAVCSCSDAVDRCDRVDGRAGSVTDEFSGTASGRADAMRP